MMCHRPRESDLMYSLPLLEDARFYAGSNMTFFDGCKAYPRLKNFLELTIARPMVFNALESKDSYVCEMIVWLAPTD